MQQPLLSTKLTDFVFVVRDRLSWRVSPVTQDILSTILRLTKVVRNFKPTKPLPGLTRAWSSGRVLKFGFAACFVQAQENSKIRETVGG